MFSRRSTPHETSDYGFVDPSAPIMAVTDWHGRIKPKSPLSFRKGTASQLRTVAKHSKRRRSPGPKTLKDIAKTIKPGGKSIRLPIGLGRQMLKVGR